MASQPISIAAPQATERVQKHVHTRAIPVRTVVAVFCVLLILFAWLHFVLALQIASTNQQIYQQTEELAKTRRHNAVLLSQIAEAESPQNFEQRAIQAQYKPQQPRYLMVPGTFDAGAADQGLEPIVASAVATEMQASSEPDRSLTELLAERLNTWLHTEVEP